MQRILAGLLEDHENSDRSAQNRVQKLMDGYRKNGSLGCSLLPLLSPWLLLVPLMTLTLLLRLSSGLPESLLTSTGALEASLGTSFESAVADVLGSTLPKYAKSDICPSALRNSPVNRPFVFA